jgi:hypothetical protein
VLLASGVGVSQGMAIPNFLATIRNDCVTSKVSRLISHRLAADNHWRETENCHLVEVNGDYSPDLRQVSRLNIISNILNVKDLIWPMKAEITGFPWYGTCSMLARKA